MSQLTPQFKQDEIQRNLDNLELQEWRTGLQLRKAKALNDKPQIESNQKQIERLQAERAFYETELKSVAKEAK